MLRRTAIALMIALLLAACAGGADTADQAAEPAQDDAAERAAGAPATTAEGGRDGREAPPAPDIDDADTDAEEGSGGLGGGVAIADLPEAPAGDKVIKEGSVTIAVEAGTFDRSFARVVRIAADLGGNVISSTTDTTDGGDASGSITVRVPVERYEQLLVGVADIGEIRSRDIRAQDVTGEYTDLESRLRHLQAQERFYLELLADVESIADAISLRQQLDGLQSDIEQVKGRLQLLDARTSFSVLTVQLFEPDAPPGEIGPPPAGRPSLAEWWASAQDALVNVVGAMLVAAFFVGPLLVPVLLAWMAWRSLRRREVIARPTPEPGT
jgi:hypothetical protein